MYIAEEKSHFPFFYPFRPAVKRSPPANYDLISQSFDDNVLRRLKALNPPSISLSWLSLSLDFLSAVHAEALSLISSHDDTFAAYFVGSIRLLDTCNSVSAEIERLRQRHLLINLALRLLEFPCDDRQLPAEQKLRRSRDLLSNWQNSPLGRAKRDRSPVLEIPPRGKILSEEKIVRRTNCTIGVLASFVAQVAESALYSRPAELPALLVPPEFVWSHCFNELHSTIMGKMKKGRFFDELDELDARVTKTRQVLNVVVEGDEGNINANVAELRNAVKELEAAAKRFTEGLDGLSNKTNGVFDTVLCTRNGKKVDYRKTQERDGENISKSTNKKL